MNVDRKLDALMTRRGYQPWHTGGGCFAWHKALRVGYLMITSDSSCGSWKDRDNPNWICGRYLDDPDEDGWICHLEVTLWQALDFAEKLPVPSRGEERCLIPSGGNK